MSIGARIADWSVRHYKLVTVIMVTVTVIIASLAVVPSILYHTDPERQPLPLFNPIRVDTDPENMLSDHEPVRVFNDNMKKVFSLHDMVVVGIVNESNPNGVFNPESLKRIYDLTQYAKTLQWDIRGKREGVVEVDLIAPSTVDNIEQAGIGTINFEWLMSEPPKTEKEALAIRDKAMHIPFLKGTLVSEDGKAIALYLPLTRKDLSHRVYTALHDKIATFKGNDNFYITGLPVAEDVFGVEMFYQMAISAPLAMAVIFLLMLLFFRKLVLIISPMIIAMVSVIITMGTLIIAGFPVHIMSSMIPIFIMPIAVLDAVHILSEFFDRYQKTRDRHQTIVRVMDELFMPMLYTSLTSAAGFASLALTPIPPVQVFGLFVALGVMAAWVWTVTFMPAYVMFIKPQTLEKFGAVHAEGEAEQAHGPLGRVLKWIGGVTYTRAKPILVVSALVLVVAGYGISRIEVNDNPVKWFTKSHPIRVADDVLNDHFGGTYMAYLALQAPPVTFDPNTFVQGVGERATARGKELESEYPQAPEVFAQMKGLAQEAVKESAAQSALRGAGQVDDADRLKAALAKLQELVNAKRDAAQGDAYYVWDEASLFVDAEGQRNEVFKQPEVQRYVAGLEQVLAGTGTVGKSNSLATVVKTVHRELLGGEESDYRVPDSKKMVAETLMQFQNSHRPQDLWHFTTPDYRSSSIWVQLTSGDNKDMSHVAHVVNAYMQKNPPPDGITHNWYGLTYINVVWQDKMVWGMLQAFAGSFVIVFLLMTILFRSALWGALAMVPLTVTIAAIYGAVGLVGKAYDMPVAVLSSMSLGLAVDFAIHFLARSRRYYEEHPGTWEQALPAVFGEPARAITRNIIVIATGFTPLLFAPLVPYKTVGVLLATILLVSGVATLLMLPALIRVLERPLFRALERAPLGVTCNCAACLAVGVASAVLIALSLQHYWDMGWTTLTLIALATVPVSGTVCGLVSRRRACRVEIVKTGEPV